MNRALALVCLLVAACSETQAGGEVDMVTPLDAAAIDAGVIADPQVIDLSGSYADTGGTGNDAFCARGSRDQGYKVGVLVTFGSGTQCEGTGRAALQGERARISLSRTANGEAIAGCSFDAYFDGSALALPGSVPAACAAVCSDRASLAGASFALIEQGDAAARGAAGRDMQKLCAD
ncbi:hypothetical protein [Blastomonas sp. AAP53]|uniref:hypothetical protein n=1 Tax=Blastomonas sp. AAP53 TaxID=1248760 RepID=UPI00031FFEE6|nr:hypothetical protein [Blastomonas sp. AAP53]